MPRRGLSTALGEWRFARSLSGRSSPAIGPAGVASPRRRVDGREQRSRAILRALQRHRVRYVLIGGAAAQTRGWRGVTVDVDITPDRNPANLERLAEAMKELDARFRVERYPDGFRPPGGIDAHTFRAQVSVALLTRLGPLDVALLPDGTGGYENLVRRATRKRVAGTRVTALVASAEDILRSKTAAGRPKDHDVLPQMQADFERARELASPGLGL